MSDVWYYAVDDKAVGPLSLTDLTAIFSRHSNARDTLVWRAGFERWQKAGTVSELAACVINPPPLPPSLPSAIPLPQVLPVSQTLGVGNQESSVAGRQSANSKRSNLAGFLVSAVVMVIVVSGVR